MSQPKKRAKNKGSPKKKTHSFKKGKSKVAAQQKENRSAQDKIQTRKVMLNRQINQMRSQEAATTTAAGKAGLSPTTAPSTSPTRSDEAGRVRRKDTAGRIPARSSSIAPIGTILKLSAHRYCGEAWQFADEVLMAVGYLSMARLNDVRRGRGSYPPDQENERAHWAKAWHTALDEFDGDGMAWLRTGIVKRAQAIRNNRGRYKNPESYLMASWQNLLRDLKRKGKGVG